jgi:DeoR family fructose operon transcriptional repressor
VKERTTQNREIKQRIARFIADYVHDNETLMMDAGSTTLEIARMLQRKKGISVVTNSAAVAEELVGGDGFHVIMTGGELRALPLSMVGPITEYTIRQFRAHRAILGMSAMKADEGLFTVTLQEAEVKRTMIRCSKEVIIAMDASKIGKVLHSFVCDFSSIDKLVTDDRIPLEEKKEIEEQGVEVIVV